MPGNAADVLECTVSEAATAAGDGDGAYLYMAVDVVEAGNFGPGDDLDDWYRFVEVAPPDVAVDQAVITGMAALLGRLAEVLEAGGAVADLFRRGVQGINETVVLDGQFTMKVSASGTYEVQDNGSGTGGLFVRLPTQGADADIADIDRVIHTTTWIELGAWRVVPSGNISKSHFLGSAIQYTFDYLVVDGAKPAVDSTFYITLDGADTHRGEFLRQVFRSWAVTIGGKGRGGEGDLWTAAGNDSDASWTSTPAKRAKAKAALNTGAARQGHRGLGGARAHRRGARLRAWCASPVRRRATRTLTVPADKPVGHARLPERSRRAPVKLPAEDQGGDAGRRRRGPDRSRQGDSRLSSPIGGIRSPEDRGRAPQLADGRDAPHQPTHTLVAGDHREVEQLLGDRRTIEVSLAGSPRGRRATRTGAGAAARMGNNDIDLKLGSSGTLKIFSAARHRRRSNAAGTDRADRRRAETSAAIFTAIKTGDGRMDALRGRLGAVVTGRGIRGGRQKRGRC